jgi:hypothetical protein
MLARMSNRQELLSSAYGNVHDLVCDELAESLFNEGSAANALEASKAIRAELDLIIGECELAVREAEAAMFCRRYVDRTVARGRKEGETDFDYLHTAFAEFNQAMAREREARDAAAQSEAEGSDERVLVANADGEVLEADGRVLIRANARTNEGSQ